MNLDIVYEDNHLLIVNKPCGVLVQSDKTGDKPLVTLCKEYLKERDQKPGNVFLGVTHRIDRPTSGIVVFAKTSKALGRFNKLLREKKVQKTYWAMVKKNPIKKEDTLTHYLKKNPKNNKSSYYQSEISGSKKAISHYKIKRSSESYHLLEVNIETGRHHQIRCQLASIGSPVKGDLKYGYPRSNKDGGIALHAYAVEFIHPIKLTILQLNVLPSANEVWGIFVKD